MNALQLPNLDQCWWPVATTLQLSAKKPMRVYVHAHPIVLFRDKSLNPAALADRCPHRFAPLSQGQCKDGGIQCPYHGWTFNAQGTCIRIPGSETACNTHLLTPYPCVESHGLIWLKLTKNNHQTLPDTRSLTNTDAFFITTQAAGSVADVAENFLDAYHTHFVHQGLVRRDNARQSVRAHLRPIEAGVEVEYQDEGKQSGWISSLFESSRGKSVGRFLWPNLAEIEYYNKEDELTLRISAWLTPMNQQEISIFARIATPRGFLPKKLKQLVLSALFNPVMKQDKHILEAVYQNRQAFEQKGDTAKPLDSNHDLLAPAIRTMLQDKSNCAIEPRQHTLFI